MKPTIVLQRLTLLSVLMCHCLAGQICLADAEQDEVVRTAKTLKRIQRTSPEVSIPFDIEARLGFLDYSSAMIHFQRDGLPFVGELQFAASENLRQLRPGAEIRVQGAIFGRRFVSVNNIIVIAPEGRITPRNRLGIAEGDRVVPDLYSRVSGTVQDIMRRPTKTFVRIKTNDLSIDVIISEPPSVEECLNLIGKSVNIEGTFRRTELKRFALMVMRLDQFQLLEAESVEDAGAEPERVIEQLRVRIHFSDKKRIVLAQSETAPIRTYMVHSNYSERIRFGDTAMLYCVDSGHDYSFSPGLSTKNAVFIDIVGNHAFAETAPVATVAALAESPQPAVRVELRGVVKSKLIRGRVCEFMVESEERQFLAVIAGHHRRATDCVERGDMVAVSGLPLLQLLADGEKTRPISRSDFELVLFVGRTSDLAIEAKPILVSHGLLGGILSALAVFIGGAFLWVRSLRHQVGVRTENLHAVTSHLAISFEAAKGAVLLNDQHGMVSRVNDRFADTFRFAPKNGTPVEDCLKQASVQFERGELFQKFCSDLLAGCEDAQTIELSMDDRTLTAYGSPIIDSAGARHGHFWSFEDITENRRLEQEFLQSQKMEAIGQLSGGLAHDFNNLLTVIGMNLSLLELNSQNSVVDSADYIEPIQTAVSRAAELTQQLLGFSRKSQLNIHHVDANKLVENVYRMAGRILDSTIDVSLCLHREPLIIEADVTRMEQVLLNFCINARDAIDRGHGCIRLRTRLTSHPGVEPSVCIEVEDDGQGMLPEVKARIFEPFFTTKPPGEGTGLGLSTAIGVVKQLGGEIQCDSTWESGTTFRIIFAQSHHAQPVSTDPSEPSSRATRQLRLLLVDDEEALRLSGRRILESLGHTVQTASNGREAIERIESDCDFDAVLLDLTMPEMTGHEAYEIISERWPQMAVAICSGYSAEHIAQTRIEQSTVAFLPKPFRVSDLAKTLSMLTKQTS